MPFLVSKIMRRTEAIATLLGLGLSVATGGKIAHADEEIPPSLSETISPAEQQPWETYGQYVFRVAFEEGENWRVRSDWLQEVIFREYRDYILGSRNPEEDKGPFY